MGAVLEVPAAAAPWGVEVRSESSYVFLGYEVAGFPAACQGPRGGLCAVTLDRSLLASLAEVVGVLLAHPALARWQEPRGWTSQSAGCGEWTLTGPALVYFEDGGTRGAGLSRTLEVEHRWLAGLRATAAGVEQVGRGGQHGRYLEQATCYQDSSTRHDPAALTATNAQE